MKPQPTPMNDLSIGLATIKSTTHGWIAPGGALTLSREVAEGWAKVINRQLVNERICKELPAEESALRHEGVGDVMAGMSQAIEPLRRLRDSVLTPSTQSEDN